MTTVNSLRTCSRVRYFFTGALGLLIALGNAEAVAAPGATATKSSKAQTADQKAAKGLLERGQKELQSGHPEQALASFNAAQKLDATLPVAEAIANAMLAMGKPADAARGYSAALESNRSTLTPAALSAAQTKLDELNAASAQLVLEVAEPDVEVQLDAVDVGRTPLPALLANPGPHQVMLKKAGFVALTQQLLLVRGPNTQAFQLVREVVTGKLHVTTDTTHATSELLIDNQVVGLLPWEGTLPVGKVTLIGRNSDETSAPVEAAVERDATTAIVLSLKPNAGTLDVSALAAGVRVSVDGRPVGVQNFRGPMPVGRHHLKLERDGFVTQEQEVDVRMNETSSFVIGNWVPLKVALPPPPDDHGMYYRLDLSFNFSNKTDGLTQYCEQPSTKVDCSTHAPFGGNLGLRVGYRFKWIAPELWGMGSFTAQFADAHYEPSLPADSEFYGPKRSEDYVFFRYGWAAGAGVRVTSPTRSVSATGGLGFGVFSMWGQYARATQGTQGGVLGAVPNASSSTSSVSHTYAPGFLLDGGVLFGSSPGAKLYLGVMLAIEFAPEHAPVAPQNETSFGMDPKYSKYGTPGLDIVSGTQFRFGPVLGFQFGY
ncbi:MAG TPA: PEGA domain-containing protein [Polyangiaceae bacterium]